VGGLAESSSPSCRPCAYKDRTEDLGDLKEDFRCIKTAHGKPGDGDEQGVTGPGVFLRPVGVTIVRKEASCVTKEKESR